MTEDDAENHEKNPGAGPQDREFLGWNGLGEACLDKGVGRLVDHSFLQKVKLARLRVGFLLDGREERGVQFGMLLLNVSGNLPVVHLGLPPIDEQRPNCARNQDGDDPAHRVVGQEGSACGKPDNQASDRRHQSPPDGHHAPLPPKVLPSNNGFQIRS